MCQTYRYPVWNKICPRKPKLATRRGTSYRGWRSISRNWQFMKFGCAVMDGIHYNL